MLSLVLLTIIKYIKYMSEQKNEQKIFSTRDLYLASTLVTLKFFLTGIDYQISGNKNQPIGYFKFENTPEIRLAKSKFVQGLLSVEPKLFITNLKSLKSEIVGVYNNPHMASM